MIILAGGEAHMAQNPGWGKLAALVLAGLLFWAGKSAYERWIGLKNGGLSPTDKRRSRDGVKPQVGGTADTVLTPQERGVAVADNDLESFVREHVDRLPTKEVVRQAADRFRASKSTVLRRLREARERKEYGP